MHNIGAWVQTHLLIDCYAIKTRIAIPCIILVGKSGEIDIALLSKKWFLEWSLRTNMNTNGFQKVMGLRPNFIGLFLMEKIALPCIWVMDWMHGLARNQGSVLLTHTHMCQVH